MNSENKQKEALLGMKLGTMLQIQTRQIKEYGLSSLVGKVAGQFLIVHTPSLKTFPMSLKKENHIIVRYVHNGMVYGFQCTLIHFMDKPFGISFLSYPESIETVSLRSHERVSCFIPATAKIKNAVYDGVIMDLSITGCSFYHLFQERENAEFPMLEKEEPLSLTLQLTGESGDYTIEAIVRSSRQDSQKIVIGAQFQDLHSDVQNEISEYIRKISAFQDIESK